MVEFEPSRRQRRSLKKTHCSIRCQNFLLYQPYLHIAQSKDLELKGYFESDLDRLKFNMG